MYLIIIAGPTAVGKTSLAIRIAKLFETEIVSADSRQFYKELSIGTAKPSERELAEVPHHFINSLSIHDEYSVGDYERDALQLLEQLFKTHRYVILCGGSGLFINAIREGFDTFPDIDPEVRASLNREFADKGVEGLRQALREVDPAYSQEVDLNNPRRLIRALEVFKSSGIPYSEWRKKSRRSRPFQSITIGLNLEREPLYQRINNRVDEMMEQGLLNEAKDVFKHRHLNALNTVGYSELFDYLDGKHSLERAVELIKQNTRHYAKRQLTWFRKTEGIRWFAPDDFSGIVNEIRQQSGESPQL